MTLTTGARLFHCCMQVQPFNINVTDGPKTCNRGEDWGTYKDVVNCNTCRLPGLRITKESIWGFFEGRTPEDRLGLPLERSREVSTRIISLAWITSSSRVAAEWCRCKAAGNGVCACSVH